MPVPRIEKIAYRIHLCQIMTVYSRLSRNIRNGANSDRLFDYLESTLIAGECLLDTRETNRVGGFGISLAFTFSWAGAQFCQHFETKCARVFRRTLLRTRPISVGLAIEQIRDATY